MSKYFTKFLPVEGDINPNEKFIHSDWNGIHTNTDITLIDHPNCRKAKLFLCSRDIQVGDKLQTSDGGTFQIKYNTGIQHGLSAAKLLVDTGKAWKVIGEISPDALSFVSADMEFEEENLKIPDPESPVTKFVYIKCPTCKHYH